MDKAAYKIGMDNGGLFVHTLATTELTHTERVRLVMYVLELASDVDADAVREACDAELGRLRVFREVG